jgi:hypothetical protein
VTNQERKESAENAKSFDNQGTKCLTGDTNPQIETLQNGENATLGNKWT